MFKSKIKMLAKLILLLSIFAYGSNSAFSQVLPDFTQLVEDNADAIVNVSIVLQPSNRDLPMEKDIEELLQRLYPGQVPPGFERQPRERSSLGSGFIISEDGYIVTNHHVIDRAEEITVTLNDQREYSAELIGSDAKSDLAVLKIEEVNLSPVVLGNSDELKVGEWVLAIGSPFGLSYSVSAGIISYMGRSLPSDGSSYVSYIQTDVAINPGHSGGPLFNLQGEVIGINSQIFSNSGGSIGLSFAIPVDVAKNVVGQLRDSGSVRRGWMGVAIADVSQELAEAFNLKTPHGALVNQVITGSPAESAGFRSGDVIVSYNDEEIRTSADLPYQVGLTTPGTSAEVEIIRDGRIQIVNMTVGDLDASGGRQLSNIEEAVGNALGLVVSELSDELKTERSLESGILVDQISGEVAVESGLQVGDILLSLNNQQLDSVLDFERIVQALPTERALPLLVARGDSQAFFTIRIPE